MFWTYWTYQDRLDQLNLRLQALKNGLESVHLINQITVQWEQEQKEQSSKNKKNHSSKPPLADDYEWKIITLGFARQEILESLMLIEEMKKADKKAKKMIETCIIL